MRDLNENRRSRILRKKKKKLIKKIIFFMFELLLIFILLRFSLLFDIKEIEVKGNFEVSKSDILKKSGVSKGDNLFAVSKSKVAKELKKIPMIKNVGIERALLHKLSISIEEKIPVAEFIFNTKKYVTDKDLNVISLKGVKKDIITVQGFLEKEPQEERLFSEETMKEPEVLFIKKILNDFDSNLIENVSVANSDIVLKLKGNTTVYFGDAVDFNYKTNLLKEMISDINQRQLKVKIIDMTKGKYPVVILDEGEGKD